MKLEKEIVIQPPPYTSPDGQQHNPPQYRTSELNITYISHPQTQTFYVSIEPSPSNILLFKEETYSENITIAEANQRLEHLFKESGGPQAFLQKTFPPTLEADPYGPGSILHGMFSMLGIQSSPTCSCKQHALEMNVKGIEWCEDNIDVICGWLREESEKRKIPYVETVAKMVVNRAINKAKKYRDEQK